MGRRSTEQAAPAGGPAAGRLRSRAPAALALALLLTGCAGDTGPTRVVLDPEARFQTIDSWAVYPRYWEHDKQNDRFDGSWAPHAEKISRFLVDEVGINGVRIEIWSGLENPVDHWSGFVEGRVTYRGEKKYRYEKVNDDDDPFTANPAGFQLAKFDYRMRAMALPLIRALEARGERMHVNLNYVDFEVGESQGTLSHARNPEEFAEFVLFYFEHLRSAYGIVPDSFEVILEPGNTKQWRGPEIGRAIVAVERRLRAAGFEPEIVAPSNATLFNTINYFDDLAQVPGALEALDVLAYHRYGDQSSSLVREVADRARTHGLKTAMLEKIGAGIDELIEDLTLAGVSSWQQWGVAGLAEWAGSGAYYALADMTQPDDPPILMDRPSHHLAHVFRYVRRGAVRIGATSDVSDKRPVAFVNADGRWVVVVRARKAGGQLVIEGLPPGRYGVRFTGEDLEARPGSVVAVEAGAPLELDLPGPGVVTVHAE